MDAIPSDESISPLEEDSVNSFNREESLLSVFDDFLFDEELMNEVKSRPKNEYNRYSKFSKNTKNNQNKKVVGDNNEAVGKVVGFLLQGFPVC